MDTPGVFFDMAPATGGGRKGTMIQLALKLAKLTANGLKNLAASVVTGLTGNAHFPAPTTTPVLIQGGIDDLIASEAALSASEDVVTMNRQDVEDKTQALRDLLTAAGTECLDTVKTLSEADARMAILSANLPIKSAGSPVDEVDRPQNFHITQGDHSQEVDGGCNKVLNSQMYRVRFGPAVDGPWETKYEGKKSSFTIAGLPTGICFMQMAAFGTNGGWSDWSDVASIHVL